MDILAEFLGEYCILDTEGKVETKDLYGAYDNWCKRNREKPLRKNTFGMRLAERGFEKTRIGSSSCRGWKGLRLNQEAIVFDEYTEDPTDIHDIHDIHDINIG